MKTLAGLILLAFAAAAAAQVPANLDGSKAMGQLQNASSADMGAVADGSAARDENGVRVVSTQKNVLIKSERVDDQQCTIDDPGVDMGAHGHPIRTCTTVGTKKIDTYGDRQTLQITDREKYVSHQSTKWGVIGGVIGGAIGALGFLALLAGPIGWLVGGLTVAAGAAIGAGIGYSVAKSDAKSKPATFTENVNTHDVVTRP